jgi:hypothetical protein
MLICTSYCIYNLVTPMAYSNRAPATPINMPSVILTIWAPYLSPDASELDGDEGVTDGELTLKLTLEVCRGVVSEGLDVLTTGPGAVLTIGGVCSGKESELDGS